MTVRVMCLLLLLGTALTVAEASPNAAQLSADQSIPTGVWTVHHVSCGPWTLHLRVDGDTVQGTVQQLCSEHPLARVAGRAVLQAAKIYDGSVAGNKITFKADSPVSNRRTITFRGVIKGDQIAFTRTVTGHPGGFKGGIWGAKGSDFTAVRDSHS